MIWWIDAGAGASGDMLLGALLDLDPEGLPAAQGAVDDVLDQPQDAYTRMLLENTPTLSWAQ